MKPDMKKTIGIFVGTCIIAFIVIFAAASLTSKGNSLEKQLQLGQNYLAEAKYEEAVVAFQKVLKMDPKQMSAYAGISEALVKLGRTDEAETWLEQALDLVESDYSENDERFHDTSRVLAQLIQIYEEKEEAEKVQHVRQILKEKGLADENLPSDDVQEHSRLSVARPDLTKRKLEQVICYLYSTDNGGGKQWQFDQLTEEEAGQITESALSQYFLLNCPDQLNLNIEYADNDGGKISKETALQFLNKIGIKTETIDFKRISGLKEENGTIISDESNYSEYQLFAHIVNMVPGKDGSLTVTGNVGWTSWPAVADVTSDLDSESVSHFKAVFAATEDPYLDGYVFTEFVCGDTDYNSEYNTFYDASGEAAGFAKLLQDLYDKPEHYIEDSAKRDAIAFTVADVNQDGKTELIVELPEIQEDGKESCYEIWQWDPRMKEAFLTDDNASGSAYYGVNGLMRQDSGNGGFVFYRYSAVSDRYVFWDSVQPVQNNYIWAFDRMGQGEVSAEEKDAVIGQYCPQNQQFNLQWKKLTQDNIDALKMGGIWKTDKDAAEETTETPESISEQNNTENTVFAAFLRKTCQNPKTYLDEGAVENSDYNRFALTDIDQDGKNELLIEYEMEMGPGVLTGIWRQDGASENVISIGTLGGIGQYYSNGVISVDVAHNHTYGEKIWPYTLNKYDAQTGTVDSLAYAWCTDTVLGGENGAYKAEEDLDQDGVIYYFQIGQELNEALENAQPYTKAEYDAFVAQYAPEEKKITLDWQKLTLGNVDQLAN